MDAPRRGVVDVLVGRLASAQAFDQPPILEEIHAAVAARGVLHALGPPERMLELREVPIERLPLILGTPAFDVNPVGPSLNDALGALHQVDTAVGPGVVGVVAGKDRPALARADDRCVYSA